MVGKKPTYNHLQISEWLRSNIKKNDKKLKIYEYLEEIHEISEKLRDDLFEWDKIPGVDEDRLKNFIEGEFDLEWDKTAKLNKSGDNKTISLNLPKSTFLFVKLDTEVTLEQSGHTLRRFDLKYQDGKNKIYEKDHSPLDSNLPIDLISVKGQSVPKTVNPLGKLNYYTFFFIASTSVIPDSLIKEILFCKFYLSRIISPLMYEMILVSSNGTRYLEHTKCELDENGIGLLRCIDIGKLPEEIISAQTIRKQIIKDIEKELINKIDSAELSTVAQKISLSFDKYIHDAIDAVAGVRPEKFAKRYIDKKIFEKIFNLKNVSFREDLIILINEHLTEKGDEYEFANEVFQSLWKECLGLKYTHFLKKYEPSIQYISAARRKDGEGIIYRDHYLHQFQVFLLGLSIIDCLYDQFKEKYKYPELSWLICSSFHDIAYPVQQYDEWSTRFFKEVFNISTNPSELDLKSNFVNEGLLYCTTYIINSLYCCHLCQPLTDNWLDEEHEIVKYFFNAVTKEKNHGILSSISLLKMIQSEGNRESLTSKFGNFTDCLKDIFVPGALAIALHEDNIWKGLIKINDTDEKPKSMKSLKFECDPLSFLMVFCDNVQDWGRPSKALEQETFDNKKYFLLQDFQCNKDNIRISLYSPNLVKTEKLFTRKQDDLKAIQSFLEQPSNISFTIALDDKYKEGEKFTMRGPGHK